MHNNMPEPRAKDYILFTAVILFIFAVSLGYEFLEGFKVLDFMRVFMGVFFLVFAVFKLLDIKGFVMSYTGYDIIARLWTPYAYAYPFLELGLALGFFFSLPHINIITVIIMALGSVCVLRELLRGSKIKCACLGAYINLPLTTVSLVEDLAMGIMSLLLLIYKG